MLTSPEDVRKPVLEISDLSIQLPHGADRTHAVASVGLSVRKREILCVVGESGSGKSILAHTVMGLLPPAVKVVGGSVRLDGEDLLTASKSRLRTLRGSRMSMIFQEPMTALNPVVKVGKQIAEVLGEHTTLSQSERRRRVIEMLQSVNLPDPHQLFDAYPHQLSGGQRQRVMIAAALILRPALLIADEPTTALDVTTQSQILQLIKGMQAAYNMGVLFITHDFGVVADIADRVAVMQRGQLVEIGAADTVLSRPQHPYTRMLLSCVPSLRPNSLRRATSGEAVLSVVGMTKSYRSTSLFGKRGDVDALKGVSLEICRKETFGVVGESGSGKSTLARCIVRLIEPTSGTVRLGAHKIGGSSAELRSARKRVQIVFQDPYRSLNPRRTVGQSIIECPMNFGLPRPDAWARAEQLMTFIGLDPVALHRLPHEFSGGQRQRICIARALAVEPELLVADEAVSALDVSVQAQVLKLLEDVRQRFNLAVLFITHDLRVAAQVCDRIAVMHRGSVVEHGPTADVFLDPKHEYTRQLLASAPGRNRQFAAITE
jgi:peptide/nickel transport system ATP-binding protein